MPQKSVYLAGPEVFLANAREILDIKIELTRAAGLIPVSPGDLEFPKTDSAWDLGLAISRIDEQLMNSADSGLHHRVMVMNEGFAWNGKSFNSLSAVAKAITGTNWNGNRFFGLGDKQNSEPSP